MKHDWDEIMGLVPQKKKSDYFERPLVKMLFPLGGFLVGAIGLLTSSNRLPVWALAVLVSFVAICAAVLLWPPIEWCITQLRQRLKRNRAARLFYPELEQTIRRLHEHLGESTTHTLIHELRDFTSIRDKQGNNIIASLSEAINIKEWLATVGRRANRRRPSDFVDVATSTSLAAAQYRRLCESLQNRLHYLVSQNLIEESDLRKLKNGWNSARDTYASLMQDWAKTCDKTNHELGSYVGPAHYAPLRTLE